MKSSAVLNSRQERTAGSTSHFGSSKAVSGSSAILVDGSSRVVTATPCSAGLERSVAAIGSSGRLADAPEKGKRPTLYPSDSVTPGMVRQIRPERRVDCVVERGPVQPASRGLLFGKRARVVPGRDL